MKLHTCSFKDCGHYKDMAVAVEECLVNSSELKSHIIRDAHELGLLGLLILVISLTILVTRIVR